MFIKYSIGIVMTAFVLMLTSASGSIRAQSNAATPKSLRCVFPLNATGSWKKDGAPDAAVKPTQLLLRFDAINADEGTAELRNGTVGSGITLQLAEGNMHFIQSFRSGPLYVTTVFGKDAVGGKLKAVHSRHEYFKVPLDGATSSPEQYYGDCEPVN